MTNRNIWNPTFAATLSAIFDAAEADLRALGFGEIERTDIVVELDHRYGPTIRLALESSWASREDAPCKRLRVSFSNRYTDGRSEDDATGFPEQMTIARRNLAVTELADRWVQRWGSLRWSEGEVYNPEERARELAEYQREREIASAIAGLTDRRREVLFKARDGWTWTAADKRVAKTIPELVISESQLTTLGQDVIARLEAK